MLLLGSMVLIAGCIDSPEVQMVKEGEMQTCPGKSVEQLVNGFMRDPSWESIVAEDGAHYVNIEGDITYDDADVRVLLQLAVDQEEGSFAFQAIELNGVPVAEIVAAQLVTEMCNESE